MADNRYGRDDDMRGMNSRDQGRGGRDWGRGADDRGQGNYEGVDDRNRGGHHGDRSRGMFGADRDHDGRGSGNDWGRGRYADQGRGGMSGYGRGDQGGFGRDGDRGFEGPNRYGGMSGGGAFGQGAGGQRPGSYGGRMGDGGGSESDRGYGPDGGLGGYSPMDRAQDRGTSGMMGSGYRQGGMAGSFGGQGSHGAQGSTRQSAYDDGAGRGAMSGHGGFGGHPDDNRGLLGRAADAVGAWVGREHDRSMEQHLDRAFGSQTPGGYRGIAPGGGSDRQAQHHDEQYHALRERHLQEFDRQYDEFRRHREEQHAAEFEAWRRSRAEADPARRVREHMEVVGSDGGHVGTVDNVEGGRIKLARKDPAAGGQHHYIEASQVRSVDDKVRLSQTADEARRRWQTEPDRSGAPGSQDAGSTASTGTGRPGNAESHRSEDMK